MRWFRIYNAIVLVIIGMAIATAMAVSLCMEPLVGDLTRVGGYSENDFGWNLPQEYFERPLSCLATSLASYSQHYDVVVLGDSFSGDGKWQNYFVRSSGLSVITFRYETCRIGELIQSPWFKSSPPSLVVFQVVERQLFRAILDQKLEVLGAGACTNLTISLKPGIEEQTKLKDRELGLDLWSRLSGDRINASANYLWKAALRFIGINPTLAETMELGTDSLFSNRKSDHMLYYKEDLQGVAYSEEQKREIVGIMKELATSIENNCKTLFLCVLAPNKTTMYAEYGKRGIVVENELLHYLEAEEELYCVNLEESLRTVIQGGYKDVYLPNDTYWGYVGDRAAAEGIISYLESKILLRKITNEQ